MFRAIRRGHLPVPTQTPATPEEKAKWGIREATFRTYTEGAPIENITECADEARRLGVSQQEIITASKEGLHHAQTVNKNKERK